MDNNYFNANSLQPSFDQNAPPGLAGVLYQQQQQRYQQAMGLQQLMQQQHFSDYMQDAPVRATGREADMAKNRGIAATAEPMAQEALSSQVVKNRFDERTLGPRVQQEQQKAAAGKREQIVQGITHAAALADAAASAGPAGINAVRGKVKELGLDENDPVVDYILGGDTPNEVRVRAQYVQHTLHQADRHYAATTQQKQADITKAILEANTKLDVARIRAPHERFQEIRFNAYKKQVKGENPSLSNDQVEAEAVMRMDAAQYGAAKPVDTAEGKQLEETIATYKRILGFLSEENPLHKQLKGIIAQYESQRGVRRPPYGGGGQARPGTAENPIPIR